jgi:hypothetical protein
MNRRIVVGNFRMSDEMFTDAIKILPEDDLFAFLKSNFKEATFVKNEFIYKISKRDATFDITRQIHVISVN